MKKVLCTLTAVATIALFSAPLQAEQVSVKAVHDAAAQFPQSALRRESSGTVTVEFSLAGDGRATAVDVVNSSGSSNFDHAAVRAVKRSQFVAEGGDLASARIQRTYHFAFAGEVMVDQLAVASN